MNHRIDPKQASSAYDPEYLISLLLDVGEEMLISGAEINRVEDTLFRMCDAYGFQKINVFSITEFIFLSILDPDGKIVTQTRRIYTHDNNFSRLEQLNGISRYVCAEKPDVEHLLEKINSLKTAGCYSPPIHCLGYMAGCFGFTLFFGGSLRDCLAGAVVALLIFLFNGKSRMSQINRLAFTLVRAAMSSLAVILLTLCGFGQHFDIIMIGCIMMMIPGMALTNSIRDLLCGDIVAGLLRLVESILIALAIAAGVSIPMLLLGGGLF